MAERKVTPIPTRTLELLAQRYPQFEGEDEKTILDRAQNPQDLQSTDARGWIYECFHGSVLVTIRNRVSRGVDIDDLVQDTFFSALSNLDKFSWRGPGSLKAWLNTIAVHRAIDFYRRNSNDRVESLDKLLDNDSPYRTGSGKQFAIASASRNETPHQFVEDQETASELREAVSGLPKAKRDVLRLRYFGEFTVLETARILGKQETNVKTLAHKGIRTLRSQMPEGAHQK